MPDLNRLSLTEDDPTITTTNVDNSTSDPENGKYYCLLFLNIYFNYYLDEE